LTSVVDRVAIRHRLRPPPPRAKEPLTVEILHDLPQAPLPRRAALTFGNFDGVHIGHAALLSVVSQAARKLHGPCTVVTFDPHPLRLLRPESAPLAVDTLAGRLAALQALGVDRTVVLRFDADFAARPAEWFARDVLVRALGASHIVTGPDARFGRGGCGDADLLRRVAADSGGHVEIFQGILHGGAFVSSSRVREAVAAGDVAEAASLLGRPFCLRGDVVHGDGIGTSLGFPTANLASPGQVQPADGVYAALAQVGGQTLDAVVHLGARPTFAAARPQVEVHLLDWTGDIYGCAVDLHVIKRLRGVQRFAGTTELTAQIRCDIEGARSAIEAWRGEARTP